MNFLLSYLVGIDGYRGGDGSKSYLGGGMTNSSNSFLSIPSCLKTSLAIAEVFLSLIILTLCRGIVYSVNK